MSFDMHFIRVWIVYKVIILGPWIEGVDIFFPFYGSHFSPPPEEDPGGNGFIYGCGLVMDV